MRIRHAASALVALGAASACALGGSIILQDDAQREQHESALRSSAWSVQASTDFGATWTAPVSSYGGHFPVRVETSGLRNRSAYQPLTLRTSVNSQDDALVKIGEGVLVDGDPATAADVRIRAVATEGGACAAPTFDSGAPSIFTGTTTDPVPVDARTITRPLILPGGTRTTPGAPVTVCLEVSMAANAPAPDSTLTLAWPLDISRGNTDA